VARPVVVHVLGGLGFGGNEALCLQIVRHAPPEVDNVVLYRDPGRTDMLPLFQCVPGLSVRCLAAPARSRLADLRAMTRELHRIGPRAVLMYALGVPHLLAGASARLARLPTIQASAGNPAPAEAIARRKWAIVLWLSALIGVPVQGQSQSIERSLRRLARRLPRGSGTIANGCDAGEIGRRAAAARRSRPTDGRLVIGMVARLDPIKDQATLIRAFAALAHELPEAELWLVGEGSEGARLRRRAAAEGVAARIVFWGRRADIPELLGRMDVYAFSTTRDEGFGIAVIEAMAAGLPVLAGPTGGIPELFDDGVEGRMWPLDDSSAAAALLVGLLDDEPNRAQAGVSARERFRREFDADVVAPSLLAFIRGDTDAAAGVAVPDHSRHLARD
jgi:glycosyltransferase involved in cell wall biosynthesis